MGVKLETFVVACFMVVTLLVAGQALAGADDLVKQADKTIRSAERMMHSGKNAEADTLLNDAAALIEQAKATDPNNRRIKGVETKFTRIRKNVDRKLGQVATKPHSGRPALPPKPQPKAMSSTSAAPTQTAKTQGAAKLPGGVTKRLRDIERHLKTAERYINKDAKQANYKLQQAQALFDEIEKTYAGQFNPADPAFAAVQSHYQKLTGQAARQGAAEEQAKADAAGAKAAQEKQSAEWVARFHQYLSYSGQTGHNPDMVVFVPGTSEPEKFADAQKRYEAFKDFYQKYKNTDFPSGKTWELEDLADNQAPLRLKDFEEGFASRLASVAGSAEKEIDSAMAYLERDTGWKSDKTLKPNLVDRNRMTTIRKATGKVVSGLAASDSKRKEIQAKFDALVAKDKANRQIRKERTFMTPDRYTGGDIKTLKKKAESLVKSNNKEGGKPLRCTVISENWQERTIREWTDTSKSTWRVRTTRSLTCQVAAKTVDGVRLITVALAQDKQSDGKWGALYGNLHQYSDPMLAANVDK